MKFIVMPRENPDTSGLPKDEVYRKLKKNVEKLMEQIQEAFPETNVEELGALGAVIEVSEETVKEIGKTFDCIIAPDIQFEIEPLEFD